MIPHLELSVPLDGEQGSEQRDPSDVVVRAVDRIDVPAHRRPDRLLALLLADDPVRWKGVRDALANHALHGAIRPRDERPIRLPFGLGSPPKVAERDLVGCVAAGEGEVEPRAKLGDRATAEAGAPFAAELEPDHAALPLSRREDRRTGRRSG